MAIVHEGTTTKSATGTSDTFTLPATATTGRLIVLGVKVLSISATAITATGFTSYGTQYAGTVSAAGRNAVLYRVAQAGDASSNITIAWGAINAEHGIICSVYSGVDTTTPVVTAPTITSGTMSATALTTPSVTMTQANSFYWGMVSGNANTTYTSAVLTERADFQIQAIASSVWVGDIAVAASGATGTKAVTAAASVTEWCGLALGMNPAGVATATLTQSTFRGRNDDGTETTATWKATAGTDWTQAVDTNFRVRFNIADSVAAATQNTAFKLRYSLNGGAYTFVDAVSSVVRASASANVADGAATTEQLAGAGTFNAGTFDEVDGSALGFTAATATGQDTELEYCVQIRSADVVNGDVVNLRVYASGALDAYTDTPIITVSEAAPPASLIWDPTDMGTTQHLRSR